MATPISVAAVIGSITYLTVFNLNLIISKFQEVVSGPKKYLLDRMAEEKPTEAKEVESNPAERTPYWPDKAKRFEIFAQKDKGSKPSDWLIVIFAFRLLLQKTLGFCKGGWGIVKSKLHRETVDENEAKVRRMQLAIEKR